MAHGGKRTGAGRKPGVVSQVKRDLAEMAREHVDAALKTLVDIMENEAETASARVSAANGILDRGFGRAPQALDLSNKDGTLARPHTILLRGPDDDSYPADTA